MSITLTESAARQVRRFLDQRGAGIGLRIGVRPSGCSGMSYLLEFVDLASPDDLCFESRGITLLVEPGSLVYIEGTELDFVREGLNEGFAFNNPNAANHCGCGESFTL
jgi:iron-sulfur cluster assembly protein